MVTARVVINASPNLKITNPPILCNQSFIDLTNIAITAGSDAGLSFSYWMNIGATTPLLNPNRVTTPGTYYIKATNASGCDTIAPVLVNLNFLTVSVNSPNVCVDDGSATITATPSTPGVYTYTWIVPTGTTNPGNVQSFTANIPGKYTVTITNAALCTATGTGEIFATPNATLSGAKLICAGASLTLTVNFEGTPPFNFIYTDGIKKDTISAINSNSYQWIVKPTSTTTYTILSVYNAKCSNTGNVSSLAVNVEPTLSGTRYPVVTAKPNVSLQLKARNLGANYKYQWNPSIGLNNDTVISPMFRYDREMDYNISMISSLGCITVDTLQVIMDQQSPTTLKSDLYVPKAWSPNGDGHNDKLFPIPVNIKELYYFRIFNRWGALVFETNLLRNGWDGIYRGKAQVSDVYTWTVEALGDDDKLYKKSGTSVLLR